MKFVLLISLFCVLFSDCLASQYQAVFKDDKYPGKCVIDVLILPAGGEGKHPKECQKIACHKDSKATVSGCGLIAPPPGHEFGDYIDASAPYPKCCDKKLVKKA